TERIEQLGTWYPHSIEGEYPVVDAVEPGLVTTVRDLYARPWPVCLVPDRHHERVHTPIFLPGDQLGEHDGRLAVTGCVADIVLRRPRVRRMNHELRRRRIIRGCRFEVLHVRTVAGFGHGETTRQLQIHDPGQVLGMVSFGTQQLYGAAEQSPLHTRLHHQREITEGQHFERSQCATDVAAAAVLLVEAESGPTGGCQCPKLL